MQYATGDWHVILGGETADNSDDSIKIRHRGEEPSITFGAGDESEAFDIAYDKWFYFCIDHGTFIIDDKTMQYAPHEKMSPEIYV